MKFCGSIPSAKAAETIANFYVKFAKGTGKKVIRRIGSANKVVDVSILF